jgi:hypothetical protein
MSHHEAGHILTPEVRRKLHETGRKLMFGVLADIDSLEGRPHAGRFRWRYPKIEEVASIFPNDRDTLNLVHFNTKGPGLYDQLTRLDKLAGPYCDGFQLNIVWPDVGELKKWGSDRQQAFRPYRLVIQISRRMIESYGDGSEGRQEFLTRLFAYERLATDFLFDLSGGEGKILDVAKADAMLEVLYSRFGLTHNIGVAGGLGPETVEHFAPLLRKYGWLSTDAEGKVRSTPAPENAAGGDDLHTGKARETVLRVLDLCQKRP